MLSNMDVSLKRWRCMNCTARWIDCTNYWAFEFLIHWRSTKMKQTKRTLGSLAVTAALVGIPGVLVAQQKAAPVGAVKLSDGVVKIGVLTDMSGSYSDLSGAGSITAAKMAIEDFQAQEK